MGRTFDLPRVGIFWSDAWNLSLCPRQWGPLYHWPARGPRAGQIRRIPGEHRDVDGSQQQLLVPYIFEFPGTIWSALQQRKHLLEEVGVYLEEIGANQLILREHPIWMKEEEIESGIWNVWYAPFDQGSVYQEIPGWVGHHDVLQTLHQGQPHAGRLPARDLIYQLSQCDNPYNCPHGRPVLVNFTKSDMEKDVPTHSGKSYQSTGIGRSIKQTIKESYVRIH